MFPISPLNPVYNDVDMCSYYTGLTPRLLQSRCSYTRTTYNPTRPEFLLGLRRDWQFRDFFIEGINSACRAMNVSVQLASLRDLYPTYRWTDLAAHRGIVPLPCQPSMIGIIEQYRMNIPLFLPTKVSWCCSCHFICVCVLRGMKR